MYSLFSASEAFAVGMMSLRSCRMTSSVWESSKAKPSGLRRLASFSTCAAMSGLAAVPKAKWTSAGFVEVAGFRPKKQLTANC